MFGSCSTISTVGPLHGMLGGRFILLFFTSVSFLLFRGLLFVVTVFNGGTYDTDINDFTYGTDTSIVLFLMAVQLMPQFFLSLYSTIGFSKDSFMLIIQHPSLFLMSSGKKIVVSLKRLILWFQ